MSNSKVNRQSDANDTDGAGDAQTRADRVKSATAGRAASGMLDSSGNAIADASIQTHEEIADSKDAVGKA